MLQDVNKELILDKKFDSSVDNQQFINKLFTRLVAKKITFKNVDFRYSIFDGVYLRKSIFEECNFTGCKFINSNLSGSSFNGCIFEYATFENTFIDNDILDIGCPPQENLKLKFARSLRLNYQKLGDADSANKAINIELKATEIHLLKAWKSNESYYRKKYKKIHRIKKFFEWLSFKILDLIWGNGESTWKLFRAVAIILLLIAINHTLSYGDSDSLSSYFKSLILSPQILLGVNTPNLYSGNYLTLILLVRLIMFGFFMSIILKRYNKR